MIFVDHSDAGDLLSQLFQHRLQKQHIVPVLRQKRLIKVVSQIAICHNKLFGTLKIVFRHTSRSLPSSGNIRHSSNQKASSSSDIFFLCHSRAVTEPVPKWWDCSVHKYHLIRCSSGQGSAVNGYSLQGVRAHGIDRTPIIPQHTAYTAAVDCSQHEYMEAGDSSFSSAIFQRISSAESVQPLFCLSRTMR